MKINELKDSWPLKVEMTDEQKAILVAIRQLQLKSAIVYSGQTQIVQRTQRFIDISAQAGRQDIDRPAGTREVKDGALDLDFLEFQKKAVLDARDMVREIVDDHIYNLAEYGKRLLDVESEIRETTGFPANLDCSPVDKEIASWKRFLGEIDKKETNIRKPLEDFRPEWQRWLHQFCVAVGLEVRGERGEKNEVLFTVEPADLSKELSA